MRSQRTFLTVNTAKLIWLIYNLPSKVFQVILRVSSFVFRCNRVLLTAPMSDVCVKCAESCEAEDLLTCISFAFWFATLQKLWS